jgi:type IV secretory pathway TraG/TraD family ATPase VirD4
MIAGPRTLKTSAYTVPAVLAAPGACLATSNKRDVVDITWSLRARLGTVWVFDPQGVAKTVQSFWWNPLTYIAAVDDRGRALRNPDGTVAASEVRAKKLAGQFATSSRPEGAKLDAYFDPTAEDLIGLLLLAAACGELQITAVYEWLVDPAEKDPVELLNVNRFPLHAKALRKLSQLPDKQREGVYGTAQTLMGFLRLRSVTPWITEQPGMPQFHPEQYARSTDTLYPLSKEGEGSVGALVAGLTMATMDALEDYATMSPGGRLAVPFVGVLDEAANICKLRNLDLQYSHYGSRGIILFTILQSWAQGADVWGANGIEKLWSSANNKLYGGGVDDDKFLRRLSDLIGTAEIVQRSQSVGRGGRTVSRSIHERPILTVAELRELPKGRAVLFSSGTPAVLIHPLQWFTGPQADEIQAAMDEEWV